jgi:hypothetical protein
LTLVFSNLLPLLTLFARGILCRGHSNLRFDPYR